jgi:hypothetical protein
LVKGRFNPIARTRVKPVWNRAGGVKAAARRDAVAFGQP